MGQRTNEDLDLPKSMSICMQAVLFIRTVDKITRRGDYNYNDNKNTTVMVFSPRRETTILAVCLGLLLIVSSAAAFAAQNNHNHNHKTNNRRTLDNGAARQQASTSSSTVSAPIRMTPTLRPIISPDSFAHLTARKDFIDILPAPDGKGLGAFASAPIVSGEWIAQYSGEYLTRKQVEARYWDERKPTRHDRKWLKSRKRRNQGLSGDYLFDMGDDVFIDGEDADVSTWCRFANHASHDDREGRCNTETRSVHHGEDGEELERPQLWFMAMRDIDAGEEVCYDYGVEYWEDEAAMC